VGAEGFTAPCDVNIVACPLKTKTVSHRRRVLLGHVTVNTTQTAKEMCEVVFSVGSVQRLFWRTGTNNLHNRK
jgi:hypothetical protein